MGPQYHGHEHLSAPGLILTTGLGKQRHELLQQLPRRVGSSFDLASPTHGQLTRNEAWVHRETLGSQVTVLLRLLKLPNVVRGGIHLPKYALSERRECIQ